MSLVRTLLGGAFAAMLTGCTSSVAILGELDVDGGRTPDLCGAGAFLDGTSGRVVSTATIATPFTFEGWFYLVAPISAPYGRLAAVEATGPCASGTKNWEIRVAQDGNVTATFGPGTTTAGSGANPGFGRWFHVALEVDPNVGGRLYVDGSQAMIVLLGASPVLGAGCPVRLGTADDGSSNRVQMLTAFIRYSSGPRYVETFTPALSFPRDASTLWQFDVPTTGSFPLVDGAYVFQTTGATIVSAGPDPGC